MDLRADFEQHVAAVSAAAARSLACAAEAGDRFEGVLFHAGTPGVYHADDQAVPFRPVPHFARWAPLPGPGHWLAYRPGEPTRLLRNVPRDYWYGAPPPAPLPPGTLEDAYELHDFADSSSLPGELGSLTGWAYVGSDAAQARRLGIPDSAIEPASLLASLDWERAVKTRYEVESIREAARIAAGGHAAAREAALAGASERAIHAAYLAAADLLEGECPYPNIVARDEAAAVLHYDAKRGPIDGPAKSFLIDAGAPCRGYASDITRSYALAGAHPVFRDLLAGMERLQAELVDAVGPGSYLDLHLRAARGVCALLRETGVLRVDADDAMDRELDRCFLPHGLGHHLGLQVHDVGGHQVSARGDTAAPPARAPHLRTTRPLEPGHVVTIEPGLYFIPLLLEALASGPQRDCVDWALVDALRPCGGIRVEDDVHVTEGGADNLSRPWLPGATRA